MLGFFASRIGRVQPWASLMNVVNLEMNNSPKMGSFQHSKWSDNKRCTVEVR